MTFRSFVGWLGLALVAAGILFGSLIGVRAGGVSCGTRFSPNEINGYGPGPVEKCADALGQLGWPALVAVIVLGLVLAIGSALIKPAARPQPVGKARR